MNGLRQGATGAAANPLRSAARARPSGRLGAALAAALSFAAAAGGAGELHAANRALLMATTSYQDSVYDLPGLELDIEQMRRFARKVGFEADEIRTLTGSEVTVANVTAQFETFLTRGVGPTDTVLVYYSGHGLQVADRDGDEEDRRDEGISMYDLAPVPGDWEGVLIDDDFAALLRALPSENVLVVVDACHSGTVTRGFTESVSVRTRAWGEERLAVKMLPYRGERTRGATTAGGGVGDAVSDGVVTLSAAQDDQQSYSSSKGSLFTLALAEALESRRGMPTPRALTETATALLHERLDAEYLFDPNLTGDARLFGKPIVITDAAERGEVNWSDTLALASALPALQVSGPAGVLGEEARIEIAVEVPAEGYLNILSVDAADEMILLYPNRYAPDNRVAAGTAVFPGERDFEWAAQPPWGRNMIVALYSAEPVNLFDSSLQKTREGEAQSDYVLPSLAGLSAFTADGSGGNGSRRAAGAVFLKTCETTTSCP